MRAWEKVKTAIGGTALVAMVLLLSPGVHLVKAGESELQLESSEAAACSDPSLSANAPRRVNLNSLRSRVASGSPEPKNIVVLNGRGYNYVPARPADALEATR